ncbi:Aste57867_5218 [Aphanomyces stellatus]|uniref:Aste57867_5218 protein n=1 Tax=Aphanomyces stellatus TaxID=120398 RepID=A0A485KH72_9STRA|nr:hypothetical protein As57867_005205 [Aphanomyces stellatus]VFT82291.1 Aste57867_5218 [Aphanomyces stellatus]
MLESASVYVRGYPSTVTEVDLRRHFQGCGAISRIDLRADVGNGPFAYVDFDTVAAGKEAVVFKHNSFLHDGRLFVSYTENRMPPPLPPPAARSSDDDTNVVYVQQNPRHTTIDDFRAHFADCGTIEHISMRQPDAVFIEFADVAAAREAVRRKDGSMMQESRIRVRMSHKAKGRTTPPPPSSLPSPPPMVTIMQSPPTETPTVAGDPRSPWLFSYEKTLTTPSYLAGIPSDLEADLRQTTSWYIEDLGKKFNLPLIAVVTAQTYMNRFYMLHAFSTHDRFLVGAAALFLSAKTNECVIKLTDVAEKSLGLVDGGKSPTAGDLDLVKTKLRQYEVVLLNTLSYDVVVPQPFLALAALVDRAALEVDLPRSTILVVAEVFLKDAVAGTLALQLTMDELAAGALYLSCLAHSLDGWLRETTLFAHVHIDTVSHLLLGLYPKSRLPAKLQAAAK